MRLRLLTFLAFSAVALTVTAKDMGVAGTTWPIIELDIRQLLIEDAARTNWGPVQEEMESSAKRYVDNLPKRQFTSPQATLTDWIDPSVVLSSDIQVPVKQPDGRYSWKVLAAKGTKVNPLEKIRPVTAFLLFDGADERQVKLVKAVLAKEPERIVPVEAGAGKLTETNEALGRPTFFANDAMLARFRIRYLPSLVYPGFGPRELYLGNTSYPLPYSVDEVLTTWPTLGYQSTPPTLRVKK